MRVEATSEEVASFLISTLRVKKRKSTKEIEMKHFIVLFSLLLASQAWANGGGNTSGVVTSDASAGANSGAESFSMATSIDTNNASADSMDNSINTYDSWALSIPGSTRAPAVALECLEHTAGFSIGPIFSKSGKTRYNAECVQFSRCITVVNLYAALGVVDNALGILKTCLQGENNGNGNKRSGSDGNDHRAAGERRDETQDRSRRLTSVGGSN